MLKTSPVRKASLGVAAAALLIGVPIYAWTNSLDEGNGGNVNGDTYTTAAQKSSRAERRGVDRTSTSSTYFLTGNFVVKKGRYTSVLQVLNKIRYKDGKREYGGQPVAQLAVRPVDGRYRFYIVQGAQNCSVTVAKDGSPIRIGVQYKHNSSPKFSINGTYCQKDTGRRPGYPSSTHNGRPIEYGGAYYAKLGAYNTSYSGTASTTAAETRWTSVTTSDPGLF